MRWRMRMFVEMLVVTSAYVLRTVGRGGGVSRGG